MYVLRIEHAIRDFEPWKKAFDNDPAGRAASGVRHYRVMRPTDRPNYVLIDLDFDTSSEAEHFLDAMREVWQSRARPRRFPAARSPASSPKWKARPSGGRWRHSRRIQSRAAQICGACGPRTFSAAWRWI